MVTVTSNGYERKLCDLMTIFEDNQSTVAMTKNPQHHGRAKHMDMKLHYIGEMVTMNKIELKYCKSDEITEDMLMNATGKIKFDKLRSMIGLLPERKNVEN